MPASAHRGWNSSYSSKWNTNIAAEGEIVAWSCGRGHMRASIVTAAMSGLIVCNCVWNLWSQQGSPAHYRVD
ncbi:MAG: hypothetical protein WBY44_11030, partial [Bryobacteraceae bacterium]